VLGAARVIISWFGQSRDRNTQVGRDLKAVAGHAYGMHTGRGLARNSRVGQTNLLPLP